VLSLLVLVLSPSAPTILFLGNSHTFSNDVPGMVRALLQKDNVQVTVQSKGGGFLEDIAADAGVQTAIRERKVDIVVMQAAKISSSHKYTYSQVKGTALAKLAQDKGIKTLLYAEWPRRGWDETEFILDVYRKIAKGSGATIVPVGKAWERARSTDSKLDLWAPDGNHATLQGSYLAACTLATWISDGKATLSTKPDKVASTDANVIRKAVLATWKASHE
jgi:hypothetical protein